MKKWKKYLGFLLALAVFLCMAACGDENVSGGDKESVDAPRETVGGMEPKKELDEDPEEEPEPLPDISGYVGCWKVENAPLYYIISDTFEWGSVDLYDEESAPGYVVPEDAYITLYAENGNEVISLGGGQR